MDILPERLFIPLNKTLDGNNSLSLYYPAPPGKIIVRGVKVAWAYLRSLFLLGGGGVI